MSNGESTLADYAPPRWVMVQPRITQRTYTQKPLTPIERKGRGQVQIELYGRLLLHKMPITAQNVYNGALSDNILNELHTFHVGS